MYSSNFCMSFIRLYLLNYTFKTKDSLLKETLKYLQDFNGWEKNLLKSLSTSRRRTKASKGHQELTISGRCQPQRTAHPARQFTTTATAVDSELGVEVFAEQQQKQSQQLSPNTNSKNAPASSRSAFPAQPAEITTVPPINSSIDVVEIVTSARLAPPSIGLPPSALSCSSKRLETTWWYSCYSLLFLLL